MSKTARPEPERISLATFLSRLGTDESSHAKAAAEAIDELEERSNPVRGIEQQLKPLFIASALAFVFGLALFVIGRNAFQGVFTNIHSLAVTVLLGALPTLFTYYAFRVRNRSRADAQSFDLNQKYFIPHGGIYFPASGPDQSACVVLIDPSQGWKPKAGKYDHIKTSGPLW